MCRLHILQSDGFFRHFKKVGGSTPPDPWVNFCASKTFYDNISPLKNDHRL